MLVEYYNYGFNELTYEAYNVLLRKSMSQLNAEDVKKMEKVDQGDL
jgi:hypothetical protein